MCKNYIDIQLHFLYTSSTKKRILIFDAAKKALTIEEMGYQEIFDEAGHMCDILNADLASIDRRLYEIAR